MKIYTPLELKQLKDRLENKGLRLSSIDTQEEIEELKTLLRN